MCLHWKDAKTMELMVVDTYMDDQMAPSINSTMISGSHYWI